MKYKTAILIDKVIVLAGMLPVIALTIPATLFLFPFSLLYDLVAAAIVWALYHAMNILLRRSASRYLSDGKCPYCESPVRVSDQRCECTSCGAAFQSNGERIKRPTARR
jgi:hypothetical protein